MTRSTWLGVFTALILLFGFNSFFIVSQVEQALVLEFGRPVRIETTPGLKFKLPFMQEAKHFDNRLLELDTQTKQMITADKKTILLDAFVRYRIKDPLKFYQTVSDEFGMRRQLSPIIESNIKNIVRSVSLDQLLSSKRSEIMAEIRNRVNQRISEEGKVDPETGEAGASDYMHGFGIEVVDVRVKRVDLPPENSEAIFRRMQTERQREAKEIRASGAEQALKIRSSADRQRVELLAEARKKAEQIRGEGDAEATKIFADAFGRDPAFFEFYRSMQAYRNVIRAGDTTMVLSPDSEFLRYLEDSAP